MQETLERSNIEVILSKNRSLTEMKRYITEAIHDRDLKVTFHYFVLSLMSCTGFMLFEKFWVILTVKMIELPSDSWPLVSWSETVHFRIVN